MPKKEIPINENHTLLKILASISQEEKSSYAIANELNITQSNVYVQLEKLNSNNYTVKIEKKHKLNYDKISKLFLDKVAKDAKTILKKEKIHFKTLENNELLKEILKQTFKYLIQNFGNLPEKFNLNDYFNLCKKAVSSTKTTLMKLMTDNFDKEMRGDFRDQWARLEKEHPEFIEIESKLAVYCMVDESFTNSYKDKMDKFLIHWIK